MLSWKSLTILIIPLVLCGCAALGNSTQDTINRTSINKTTQAKYIPTNPESVLLTKEKTLDTHYSLIGTIKIARRNFVGIKRQEADINDLLQTHAAAVGGNAVIDIHKEGNNISGEIIKYTT